MNIVQYWSGVALETLRLDFTLNPPGQAKQDGPTASSRAMAMVHLAIRNAWFGHPVMGAALPMTPPAPVNYDETQRVAGVAAASRVVLTKLYAQQTAGIDAAYSMALGKLPPGTDTTPGVTFGEAVGNAILDWREGDIGQNAPANYPENPALGARYLTTQGTHGRNWGGVTPFAIPELRQIQFVAPVRTGDPKYKKEYTRTRDLGGADSKERSAEQTRIGIFWGYDGSPGLGTPPRLYNQIIHEMLLQRSASPSKWATVLAAANLAMGDAGILAWHVKYTTWLWRPDVGVGQYDEQGNALPNPAWKPLGKPATNGDPPNKTPGFPAYPSGHATFGTAALRTAEALMGFKGKFTFMSDEYNGINLGGDGKKRKATTIHVSIREAIKENADSRVYLGVHWPQDAEEGVRLGEEIAKEVVELFGS